MRNLARSCRECLVHEDMLFVSGCLGVGEESLAVLLGDPETRDDLLDDERLFSAAVSSDGLCLASPEFFFYVVVRHETRGTVGDPDVADYVGCMLADRRQDGPGPDICVVDMLADIGSSKSDAERLGRLVSLGDGTIFLLGMFARHMESRRRGASKSYYESAGRQAYLEASLNQKAKTIGVQEKLAGMADRYGEVRTALNRLSEYVAWMG